MSGSDAPSLHVAIVEDRVDPDELVARVTAARAGAVVTFAGIVRDHHEGREVAYLEYEGYRSMAAALLRQIAQEAMDRWQLVGLAVTHRLGRLQIGECSVAIAASAEHRQAAFEAVRYVIDELKTRLPIWKRETGPDGSRWVQGPASRPGSAC